MKNEIITANTINIAVCPNKIVLILGNREFAFSKLNKIPVKI